MSADHQPTREQLAQQLNATRDLLIDALEAGKYTLPGDDVKPATGKQVVAFQDRVMGELRQGKLVIVEELTSDIVQASVESDQRNYVMVAGWLADDVNLGRARSHRIQHMLEYDHYWAVFILDGAVMVSLGAPPSSCRLIGEVLNLQMPTPFVQSRICANCHTLNDYKTLRCTSCGRPLTATGRLG